MDVTSDTYSEARQLIINKILPETRYIAFDLEFTGVKYEKFQRDYINLLPFQKYKKLKYIAQNYQILQLGLTFVTFQNGIKAYPFNFYLFPRNPATFDKDLKMQLSCVKFNAQNDMDWNKWINKGVNYIKISQIQSKQGSYKHKSSQAMMEHWSEDWQQAGQKLIRKLKQINKEKVGAKLTFSNHKLPSAQKTLVNLFHTYIRENQLSLSLKQIETQFQITKITEKERVEAVQKATEDACGFALLFRDIWKKRLPFIGHNCLLDLLYVYHNLVDTLPDSYFEFKTILEKSGNNFFDTKYIVQRQKKLSTGGTRLQDIFKTLSELGKGKEKLTQMTLLPPFNRYNLEKQVLHEAGYDSYITAWVYQQSMRLYEQLDKQCKNKLNINNSFFFMDLSTMEDEVNPQYSQNILRFNILLGQNQDVRQKRIQLVRFLRKKLEQFQGAFSFYQGYREVFLQIKDDRSSIISAVMKMKKDQQKQNKPTFEVNTFGAYFMWQKERVTRQYNRYQKPNYNNKGFEKKGMKEESSSESNNNHKYERGNRGK